MSSTPATPGASGAGTTATTVTVEPTAFTVAIAARTPIAVPAEQAWAVLTDFARYPEWNPFITRIEGSLTVGEHLDVELSLPGRKPVRMKPRVVAADPGRSFAWLGKFGVRGLFDGEHHFDVVSGADGSCVLEQSETLRGLLVPALKRMLTGPTPEGFASMNEALRARVERLERG